LACEYAKCKNRAGYFTIVMAGVHLHFGVLGWDIRAAGKFAMTDDPSPPASGGARKPLPPAAHRALAEAEARRKAAEASAKPAPKEFQGPKGPEPTRYGDWENKGIASDF
jgi:hypothetical protein